MAEQMSIVAEEMHVLWITAGLGCDGDTIAVTAATQPSIEDLIFGTIPGVPRIKLHNPVLAYEVGKEFLNAFYSAARGELEPFILATHPAERVSRPAAQGSSRRQALPRA